MKVLRGSVALFFVFLFLILGDPVQRFFVIPLARVWKSRRTAIMARWQHVMRWISLSPIIYIGGARFPRPLQLPGDGAFADCRPGLDAVNVMVAALNEAPG